MVNTCSKNKGMLGLGGKTAFNFSCTNINLEGSFHINESTFVPL